MARPQDLFDNPHLVWRKLFKRYPHPSEGEIMMVEPPMRMSRTPVVDSTGVGVLRDFIVRCRRDGVRVILSGVRGQPLEVLERMGLGPASGEVEYADNFAGAVALAR